MVRTWGEGSWDADKDSPLELLEVIQKVHGLTRAFQHDGGGRSGLTHLDLLDRGAMEASALQQGLQH